MLTGGGTVNFGSFGQTIGSLASAAGVGTLNLSGPLTLGGTASSPVNQTANYGGAITGAGGVIMNGLGTKIFSGANTYTGGTTVNAGGLLINGALAGTGNAVTVNGGASLGGTGSIGGSVTVAGGSGPGTWGTISLVDGVAGTPTLSDASSTDTVLTIGGSTAGSTSRLNYEVGATADRLLIMAGKLLVNPGGSLLNITALPGFGPGTYDLMDFPNGQASGLGYLTLVTTSVGGCTLSLQSMPTAELNPRGPAPQPSTLALLGVGAIGLLAYRLRRKSTRT